jgi:hypothetical protein
MTLRVSRREFDALVRAVSACSTKPRRGRVPKVSAMVAWEREQRAKPGLFVPLKTINELNDHSHWRNRQCRAKQQHKAMAKALAQHRKLPLPIRVTFTRYAPGSKPLDSDGAFAAMKFVRDAMAKVYGVDDGSDVIEWAWPVKQERSPFYGVRVQVTSTKDGIDVDPPYHR